MKRILMTITLTTILSFTGMSQSKKAEAKAEDKTEQLAEWIKAGNEDVALSDEQILKIENILAEMRMEINTLKNKYPDKKEEFEKERKKISKEYNKKVNKDILTKEQRKAKRKGKKMMTSKD